MTVDMALKLYFYLILLKLTQAVINEKDGTASLLLQEPKVDCQIERFTFEIETKGEFRGRLFVKGHSKTKECAVDFDQQSSGGNETRRAKIEIDYHSCGIERIRSVRILFGVRLS